MGVKGADPPVYVLLYMLDGGESEVTGSAAVCAADLVYYAAEGERLVGLVKTRRLMAMRKQTTYAKASSFALRATEDKPVVGQRATARMKGVRYRRSFG